MPARKGTKVSFDDATASLADELEAITNTLEAQATGLGPIAEEEDPVEEVAQEEEDGEEEEEEDGEEEEEDEDAYLGGGDPFASLQGVLNDIFVTEDGDSITEILAHLAGSLETQNKILYKICQLLEKRRG